MGRYAEHHMNYNTTQEFVTMPEYGRNVQQMVEYAKSIEDAGMRQAFAEKIVDIMSYIAPNQVKSEDYRIKLWHHLFEIAGYDIDVMPPDGVKPTPEDSRLHPEKVPYPKPQPKWRHYGHGVHQLMEKAKSLEQGGKKESLTTALASFMKLSYKIHNRDSFVTDDQIRNDLYQMSEGALHAHVIKNLDDPSYPQLHPTPDLSKKKKKKKPQKKEQPEATKRFMAKSYGKKRRK